jgi:hypothetical protein
LAEAVLLVHVARQDQPADERPVRPLDAMDLLRLFFLGLPPLAFDAQHAVLDVDLDVVLLDVGHVGFHQVFAVGLLEVDGRRPVGERGGVVRRSRGGLVEESVEAIREGFELTERIPAHHVHDGLLGCAAPAAPRGEGASGVPGRPHGACRARPESCAGAEKLP